MKLFSPSVSRGETSKRSPRAHVPHLASAAVAAAAVVALLALGGIAASGGTAPGRQAAKSGAAAGDASAGRAIFAAQGCYRCHGAGGEGLTQSETESAGPQIAPTKKTLTAFIAFVRDPTSQIMPPYAASRVSDTDLTNVYAFLQSSGAPPADSNASATPAATPSGNADNGKRLFVSDGCYQCHGHLGEGGSAGARLAPNPLDFAAIVKYVRHPTGQMPPYTAKVVPDSDLADIYAYLQSIPQAPKLDTIPLLK